MKKGLTADITKTMPQSMYRQQTRTEKALSPRAFRLSKAKGRSSKGNAPGAIEKPSAGLLDLVGSCRCRKA